MKADVKKKFRFGEAEKLLAQHQVTGAADRKKFGHSLNEPQDSGLKRLHGQPFTTAMGRRRATFFEIPAP